MGTQKTRTAKENDINRNKHIIKQNAEKQDTIHNIFFILLFFIYGSAVPYKAQYIEGSTEAG
jgi:hypothetical protein